MINNVTLVGRLAVDPELKYTQNGKAVCNLVIAVDRGYGENKETDFIPVVVWEKAAEFAANYLTKGREVGVVGRIQCRTWERTVGGETIRQKVMEIFANQLQGIGARPDANGNGNGKAEAPAEAQPVAKVAAKPAPAAVASPEVEETPDFNDPFENM